MKRQRAYVIRAIPSTGRSFPLALVEADTPKKAIARYHAYHKSQTNVDSHAGCPLDAVAQSKVSRFDRDLASDRKHITSDTTAWPYYPDGCMYFAGNKRPDLTEQE